MLLTALVLAAVTQTAMTSERAPVVRDPVESSEPIAFLSPESRVTLDPPYDYPYLRFGFRGEVAYVHREHIELPSEDVAVEERFWVAAILGNSRELRRAVASEEIDVDEPNASGWTALMHSVAAGHSAEARLLLSLGANPSAVNERGDSVLIVAAKAGRVGLTHLIARTPGVDLEAADDNGWTAFTWASSKGYQDVRDELIELGALEVAVPEKVLEGYRLGASIDPPRLLSQTVCVYSEEGVVHGVEGTVVLEVVIGANGRIRDWRVLAGLPHGLDAQAIECVRQWQFAPGTLDGEAVAVIGEVAVVFELGQR